MTTVKTAPEVRSGTATTTPARRIPVVGSVLALLVALLVGGMTGWFVRGGVDDSRDLVVAGQTQLTDRQADIADFMREYEAAWQQGDGDAVVSMFTPGGTATFLGTTYRVDDGSLAEYVDSGNWASLDVLEPILVGGGNQAVSFHTFNGATYVNIVQFTGQGELLLVGHQITY
jgi:hypothetical protein